MTPEKALARTLEHLGAVLLAARERSGKTQMEVERKLAMGRGFLSRVERATAIDPPGLEIAVRVAKEVSADQEVVAEIVLRAQVLRLMRKGERHAKRQQMAAAAAAVAKMLRG